MQKLAKDLLPEDIYNHLAETMLNTKDSLGRKFVPGYATSRELKETNSFMESAQQQLDHEAHNVLENQYQTVRKQAEDLHQFLKSRKIPQGEHWDSLMSHIKKGDHKAATDLFDSLTEEMGIRNYKKDYDL
ncbi:hypothetical protein Zmor_009071 [Zophobas morio]|uniref:Uncharacterized protein n=1 Tax=Zophobas morio TaxID=2755281 RepID=A0AA38HIB1_9CUCU|nr:hypothetical protein Zmor_009071 [Zophobas morio]